ncbi:MAG: hypothetical protein JNK30_06670 [Phenylobacterium sp.]|uniref:hypothetical protein n=1 Tax=Phenylobacterium sp. TaxID=1871053 RepID=UPI001A3901AF|nr:hypothetical protein [Phenylobacterium sp.]MBL8771050.1 hypothetical protein [Phenylobacterium sp.]
MIRILAVAGLSLSVLSACSSGGGDAAASDDPNVALRPLIAQWSKDIEATHSACSAKVEGKGCQDFQVTCKAEHAVGAADAQRGVTAQVIAAMTFAGRNPDGSTGKSGSSFALFSKAADGWTRGEAMPVNLQTCAPV